MEYTKAKIGLNLSPKQSDALLKLRAEEILMYLTILAHGEISSTKFLTIEDLMTSLTNHITSRDHCQRILNQLVALNLIVKETKKVDGNRTSIITKINEL